MGSKASASTVFLHSLNLVFFSLVSSQTPKCPQDLSASPATLVEAFFGAAPDPNCGCCSQFQGCSDEDAARCVCFAFIAKSAFPINFNEATKLFMRYCGFNNPEAFSCEGSPST
ncbi:hypothetical protein PVK06_049003 [Gossypium arboreum]|uniref:Hydrophobic seed protein domain-containing protein n=1 Tax=Gossypium arboreum TaxID=29729 RepID=A0ABR0MHF0_GOSAR|nr:hypothetical protein PVK06_049003 [Gossypium arboreum]